jgi:hypothetical protein
MHFKLVDAVYSRHIYSNETHACLDGTPIYNFSLKITKSNFGPAILVLLVHGTCVWSGWRSIHSWMFLSWSRTICTSCCQNLFLENNEQTIDSSFCSLLVHTSGTGSMLWTVDVAPPRSKSKLSYNHQIFTLYGSHQASSNEVPQPYPFCSSFH